MKLDDIPHNARRAMAIRATMAMHGFYDDRTALVAGVELPSMNISGSHILMFTKVQVAAAVTGCFESSWCGSQSCVRFIWGCGPVDAKWWFVNSEKLSEVWKKLSLCDRNAERTRWVPIDVEIQLAKQLMEDGLIGGATNDGSENVDDSESSAPPANPSAN